MRPSAEANFQEVCRGWKILEYSIVGLHQISLCKAQITLQKWRWKDLDSQKEWEHQGKKGRGLLNTGELKHIWIQRDWQHTQGGPGWVFTRWDTGIKSESGYMPPFLTQELSPVDIQQMKNWLFYDRFSLTIQITL